ncbi:PREDICTED: leucine-rich repeat-containing protein 46 [Pygoscelis adeliae]|uniref:leucine-rich repeat-containing protein 46 n=1 Tax=Pygoscelis adeliae TaxID=9238 RepID=UPI0004F4DEA3|nr:PREDICTED: leucine-rich repeat-containing protein 46 [Pygoscelis adeliae]
MGRREGAKAAASPPLPPRKRTYCRRDAAGDRHEETSPGVTLTDHLITTRNLPRLVEPPHPKSRSTELVSPSTVRLDRENICAIGRLQSLWEIHSLYLQQNHIEKIENLGCFPNLRFLSLAGNRIRRVENLRPLLHLRVLDLSHNQIQMLDPALLLWHQAFCLQTGESEQELVIGALPHLLQLDAQQVRGSVGKEEEEGGSSSSEDEDDESLSEPSGPFTAGKDFFADLHRELAGRSRRRRREALKEHRTRLEELEELRGRRGLLLPPAPLSPGREGAACITAPGPKRSQPRPQAKPGTQLPPLPGPGGQHACPAPQRAPGRSQPRTKALEKEARAEGARNRQLPQIPRTSTAPRS